MSGVCVCRVCRGGGPVAWPVGTAQKRPVPTLAVAFIAVLLEYGGFGLGGGWGGCGV